MNEDEDLRDGDQGASHTSQDVGDELDLEAKEQVPTRNGLQQVNIHPSSRGTSDSEHASLSESERKDRKFISTQIESQTRHIRAEYDQHLQNATTQHNEHEHEMAQRHEIELKERTLQNNSLLHDVNMMLQQTKDAYAKLTSTRRDRERVCYMNRMQC